MIDTPGIREFGLWKLTLEEARTLYQQGIEVTTRKGDLHARSEMQAALDLLA